MNIYIQTVPEALREANSKVVRMVLPNDENSIGNERCSLIVPSDSAKLLPAEEMVVGAVGVEPTTNGLKGRCSATELRPCC
jgi:hypothetical protein